MTRQQRNQNMEASRLQSIVLVLSRATWVRHWLHFNYPCREPWLMGIEVCDRDGTPHDLKGEMEKTGFTRVDLRSDGGGVVYTIPRSNADGDPYR